MSKEDIKKAAEKTVTVIKSNLRTTKIRIPERVEAISCKWLRDAPFFSEFLLRFNYFISNEIPTMGVNSTRGRINLFINEEFMNGGGQRVKIVDEKPVFIKDANGDPALDKEGNIQYEMVDWTGLTEDELEAVLIHEIYHIVRLHHERVGEKDGGVWNIAADMLINDDILELSIGRRKIKLPEGAVYLSMAVKDGYVGEKVTEPLYDWLIDKRQEYMNMMKDLMEKMGGQGTGKCPQCGGSGKVPKEGEEGEEGETCPTCGGSGQVSSGSDLFNAIYGSKIDDHSTLDKSDELAESTIKEIIDTAKIRGWGNISGNAVSKLEELTKPSKINWKQHLRKALAAHVFSHGSMYENNWSRRNRRSLPLPGVKKLSNRAVIGIDTSGSIQKTELEQFFTEVEKICKDGSMLTIVQWDTQVQTVWPEYKKGDWRKIEVKGRGGTDVQDMFNWMIKEKKKKDLLIMFTDGFFSENYDTYGIQTLWCVTNDVEAPHGGKKIFVEVTEKAR